MFFFFLVFFFAGFKFLCVACIFIPNVIAAPNTERTPSGEDVAFPGRDTAAPEPGPFWITAKQQWGWLWKLHWIGLGLAFALLALKSLWAVIRSPDIINNFAGMNLFYSINLLLIALGTTRSLYLWIDPYESEENIPNCPLWVVRPLFGIAFPCLMSAFCLVHVAFLEVAKIQVGSPKLKNPLFVGCIIFVHFAVVLVSDTTTAIKADRTELLIVCQSFFIIWGLLNSICFMYSGSRVVITTINIRNKICEMENAEWHQLTRLPQTTVDPWPPTKDHGGHNEEAPKRQNQPRTDLGKGDPNSAFTIEPPRPPSDHGAAVQSIKPLRLSVHVPILAKNQRSPNTTFRLTGKERAVQKVASITMITSILSILCCGLQAYSLFGVHGVYTRTVTPKPWPWFAFETSFRLIELAMGFMLSYCVLHPYVGRRKRSFTNILRPKRKGKTATPRIVITPINGRRDGDFS